MTVLRKAGLFTDGLDAILRKKGNAKRGVDALMREFKLDGVNEFTLDLETQLERFAEALPKLRQIGFTFMDKSDEEVLRELRETAPAWPEGKRCFRFVQIREGEGGEGVQKTFDLHKQMMSQTFTPKWRRGDHIKTDKDHLRLLAGNETHKTCFGWVCADMDSNRQRNSIIAVRGDSSLADEILAFNWQFPAYCKAIDYKENPGLFAAGYELSVDGCEDWSHMPLMGRDLDTDEVDLLAHHRSIDNSVYSVPSRLRE